MALVTVRRAAAAKAATEKQPASDGQEKTNLVPAKQTDETSPKAGSARPAPADSLGGKPQAGPKAPGPMGRGTERPTPSKGEIVTNDSTTVADGPGPGENNVWSNEPGSAPKGVGPTSSAASKAAVADKSAKAAVKAAIVPLEPRPPYAGQDIGGSWAAAKSSARTRMASSRKK